MHIKRLTEDLFIFFFFAAINEFLKNVTISLNTKWHLFFATKIKIFPSRIYSKIKTKWNPLGNEVKERKKKLFQVEYQL